MKEKFEGLVEHLLSGNIYLPQAVEVLERSMIQLSLQRNDGNRCAASKQLGIHRNTLQRKMVEYGVGPDGHLQTSRKPVAREAHARAKRKRTIA